MKNIKLEIKWAFIFFAVMIIWVLLEKLIGLHDKHISAHPMVTGLVAIPSIFIYIFAFREIKLQKFDGAMTFAQGFKEGMLITFLITMIAPISQYIQWDLISPEYLPNAKKFAVDNDFMSLENAQESYTLKSFIFKSLVGTPIMGFFTTIMVAYISRTRSK
jgi:hypothetical protein